MKKLLLLALTIVICVFVTSCDGKSAYDIAVDSGFQGTQAEWLESLNGRDGADGQNATSDIMGIYDAAVQSGFSGSFIDFLGEFLTVNTPTSTTSVSQNLTSVVSVYSNFVTTVLSGTFPFVTQTEKAYASAGAGVIYKLNKTSGSAYIITNYHVVYSAESNTSNKISDNIKVYLYGSETENSAIPATFIGGSMDYDIAVLKVTNSDYFKKDTVSEIKYETRINVGETAIAIGNPSAKGISVTQGIISVDSEYITMTSIDGNSTTTMRVIRIDAAINSGNSGGGLFDLDGNLIGIVNAKIIQDSVENIAYAIPASIAIGVADNVIANNGTFNKLMLGITVTTTDKESFFDTETGLIDIKETVVVSSVERNAPAYGVLQPNDIISYLEIRDIRTNILRSFHITDAMFKVSSGDIIKIGIVRNNINRELSITF